MKLVKNIFIKRNITLLIITELLKVASRKNSTDYRNRRHSTGTMLGPSGKMYLKIINDTDTGINFV